MKVRKQFVGVLKRKGGFAIILVAALAGLLFLLGASLVAVSQLKRTAANYDERSRIARNNARVALEVALGEMQEFLGKDELVTYCSDLGRVTYDEDFNEGTSEEFNPFWMQTNLMGEVWMVTEPSGGTNVPKPGDNPKGWVKLVGSNSAKAKNLDYQKGLDVTVPKKAVQSAKTLPGFASDGETQTIGNVAYWVGDLGVKASYSLYDKSELLDDSPYDDVHSRDRLQQLRGSDPQFSFYDSNFVGLDEGEAENWENSNPYRIDRLRNDFQLGDSFGSAETYLIGLSKLMYKRHFHDFTALSKGLLTDPVNGGFKRDLSQNTLEGENDAFADYLPYSLLASVGLEGDEVEYDKRVYTMRAASANSPAIMPVLTQFNLNYSIYIEDIDGVSCALRMSFNAGMEMWNPYSSELKGEAFSAKVVDLPTVILRRTNGQGDDVWDGDLNGGAFPEMIFEMSLGGNEEGFENWRPGEVEVFSGPVGSVEPDAGPFVLSKSSDFVASSDDRVIVDLATIDEGYDTFSQDTDFWMTFGTSTASPSVEIYSSEDELLAQYKLVSESNLYYLSNTFNQIKSVGKPRFGFSWTISDLSVNGENGYNPLSTNLESEWISEFHPVSNSDNNVDPVFSSSKVNLLGYGDVEDDGEDYHDVIRLELPKQEIVSVAGMGNAVGVGASGAGIGSVGEDDNSFFDDSFFSTIPRGEGEEKPSVLPNSGYVPVEGATMEELQSENAAEHLWVHGMFNVHSTSMDAWAAMLKSSPASRSNYWKDKFDGLAANERYLFFNYPQSAENLWTGFDYDPGAEEVPVPTDLDLIRQSMRQGVFALTGDQIDVLAKHIVSEIRKRYQGHESYDGESGPFASLREFVDSGVLQNAIAAANAELKTSGEGLTKDWVVTGKGYAAEFRQSTILNLLAPFLSVRSDTFLVRAYGDAVNPADPAEVWARAYCEAVVQRTHEMHSIPAFGRKLKVVAFRWLAPSEI